MGSEETSFMLCCGGTSGKETNFVSDRKVRDSMFSSLQHYDIQTLAKSILQEPVFQNRRKLKKIKRIVTKKKMRSEIQIGLMFLVKSHDSLIVLQ